MHSIFSKKDIRKLHAGGTKVYSYLNIGSIENFRSYYKTYEHLAIGDYENWEEEKNGLMLRIKTGRNLWIH